MAQPIEGEHAEGEKPRGTARVDPWHVVAVLVLTAAALITFRDVLRAGPMSSAIVSSPEAKLPIASGDVIFEAWLTARNAHTIATAPHRIFDTPHCAPASQTLTLGVPMFTMGLLAVPVALFTPNPALAYNFSTGLLLIISGLAMYLLVREWTGVPAAGVVAGLLYAFNPIRVGHYIIHPSVWDSAWLVFALFFSRRLFANGRWRDAIGLALACSLQIGASFYPLLAAMLMAPAFAVWLLYEYGLRKVRVNQLAFVFATIAGAAAVLLGPYMDAREAGAIGGRSFFAFAPWWGFLPGGRQFLGWGAMALGLVGLLLPRKRIALQVAGDPRWALVIGALTATVIAAGPFNNELLHLVWPTAPFQIPNLYKLLLSIVPGLDSIRVVLRLTVALLVAVCILAGMGAAWLLKRTGRLERISGIAMIVLALLSIIPEPYPRETVKVRADPQALRFFAKLEELGNRGPIVEAPLLLGAARSSRAPNRILQTAYHRRRISTCFGSYRAPSYDEFVEQVEQMPRPSAVESLRQLGFTTLVVYRGEKLGVKLQHQIRMSGAARLPLLHQTRKFAAYDLEPRREPSNAKSGP